MIDILIEGGTILTVDPQRRIIENGAVAVKDDRIVDVGKAIDLRARYPDRKQTIEARHKLVMPGLVDCHTHFVEIAKGFVPDNVISREWVSDYIWPLLSISTPEDEYWTALNMIAYKIRTGTTCFAECGCMFPETSVQAAVEAGVRCAVGWYCWDQPGRWLKVGPPVSSTDQVLAGTEELINKCHGLGNGRIRVFATAAGVGTASDNLWRGLKELADMHQTFFQTHCATSKELVEARVLQTGRREVEHMEAIGILDSNVLLAHTVALSEEEVRILKEHDVKVSYNPGAAVQQVKGVSQIGKFPEMLNAGVTVGVGIDSPDSSIGGDMVRALQWAVGLLRDSTLDPTVATAETAVEMGTIWGARALGLEDQIGSLEVGKKADIIIFDLRRPEWVPLWNVVQNLIWNASGESVETVIVDGKVIMENQVIKTLDVRAIVDKVEELRLGVKERIAPLVNFPERWPVV
ncbi:MAG: amidohydrolase [Ardenticatenaceae bacterium]|nr:amidohydrolase [Ardenticatenaceae bacterium]